MKAQKGFTLIELMIAVAIVMILGAFGYPSYVRHTTNSHRAAAQSFMMSVANKQEQYILDARTYAAALSTLGINTIPNDISKYYNVTLAATASTYTITATPIGSQLRNDTNCPALTLDQTGAKTPATTGSTGCW